jgi:hypothetical protein
MNETWITLGVIAACAAELVLCALFSRKSEQD